MVARLELDGLGAVEPRALRGELLVVAAPRPLPPGTRVTVREPEGERPLAQGKVASVASGGPEGSAEVTVRLFAPERAARARLLELLSG